MTADPERPPVAARSTGDELSDKAPNRLVGIPLALAGVIVLSPDALIIRLVDEDPWTVLFWRGLFSSLALLAIVALMSRGHLVRAFRAIFPIGLLVIVLQGASNVSFVLAISSTNAANVLVIIGAAPLFAAIFSRTFLGESVPRRTWVAIAVVIGAVGLVFIGTGQRPGLTGDTIALFGAVCSAASITAIRAGRGVSMIPAVCLAALTISIVSATRGATVPAQGDLALLCFQGCVVAAGAISLLTTALRFMPAPEVSLISRLELVLGPLWIWAIIGEVPAGATILGGVIVTITLTVHTVLSLRADRRALSASASLAPVDGAAPDQLAASQELVDR